jgi:uncharacterized protein (DUF305 family)
LTVPVNKAVRIALFGLGLTCLTQAAVAQRIVQPGAPGQPSRELSADQASQIADTSYTDADVRFMQDMIPHHHQALQMAELVADRTNRSGIVDVAGRIDVSQQDEIDFMQQWLRDRGATVPDPTEHRAMQMDHMMAGMATPEQMEALAATRGTAFDRMFLELMIRHHAGAVTMVEELHSTPGAAYEPVLFEFTNDVSNDQSTEIERMSALLAEISDDPRVGLSAGFDDAGIAILNLELVGSLPKPAGFFDPANPAGLPPERPPRNDDDGEAAAAESDEAGDADEAVASTDADAEEEEEDENEDETRPWNRSPLLSFSNTDMAFFDDVLVTGSYHGFNIYRLSDEALPTLLSSVVCPGGQGDVSVVGDLLIMSVEQTRGRLDCGRQGITDDVSDERFRGIRIFDISDLSQPVQVGAVQTCRGSHTHSVVRGPEPDGRIIVYNSGTSRVRDEDELEGCIGNVAGDERTALFRIDVIEIPVDDPAAARIVSSPAVFADLERGILAGLWRGGDHGEDTQQTNVTDQCHDITVFPAKNIAGGACSGNGILFDISDPLNPVRMDAVIDEGFAYWHSATFNNDGTKVLFTDEWGGGGRPRCRVQDPLTWGADAIYDIVDGKLEVRGYFKMPAPQTDEENCVAHNGAIVPVPGRDIFVQAWYQGGISVVDFTDSANPVEIAFFDRGPIDEDVMIGGGFWSAYWYGGRIYGTEIVRGLDVLELVPSDYLSEDEIAAASVADYGDVFNPQQQFPVTWPDVPVVARAYIDQLERSDALPRSMRSDLNSALRRAASRLEDERQDADLAMRIEELAAGLQADQTGSITARRTEALRETLAGIAAQLR